MRGKYGNLKSLRCDFVFRIAVCSSRVNYRRLEFSNTKEVCDYNAPALDIKRGKLRANIRFAINNRLWLGLAATLRVLCNGFHGSLSSCTFHCVISPLCKYGVLILPLMPYFVWKVTARKTWLIFHLRLLAKFCPGTLQRRLSIYFLWFVPNISI